MKTIEPKHPRLRLPRQSYEQLGREVLQRDGWRCQTCGSLKNLQVHHKMFRSQLGDDSEENLVTLCSACHNHLHGGTCD
jgi:5-methylcytosine-specific restriction endonuclease McrA